MDTERNKPVQRTARRRTEQAASHSDEETRGLFLNDFEGAQTANSLMAAAL